MLETILLFSVASMFVSGIRITIEIGKKIRSLQAEIDILKTMLTSRENHQNQPQRQEEPKKKPRNRLLPYDGSFDGEVFLGPRNPLEE